MVPEEMATQATSLTPQQVRVLDAMKGLGAVDHDHGKTADDIMKFGHFPKGQMLNWLHDLEAKGIVKREAGTKAAHYFVTKPV